LEAFRFDALNFIGRVSVPQRVRAAGLLLLAAASACGGKQLATGAPSGNPETAVRAFLAAVAANDLSKMQQLWGSDRGPAVTYVDAKEVEQRLTVIRTFLAHEKYEFDQPNSVDPSNPAQRIVKVRLTRKGCQPVVPFTTVQWKNGWLVKDIGLADAGNPARSCSADSPPGT
jgi:hypothetical protein